MTKRRGFTLGEILMAMALFALTLVTALGVLQWALLGTQRQQTQTRAVFLGQQCLESLLAESKPKSGQGSFEPPHQDYRWAADIHEDDAFLKIKMKVSGPRGAAYTLQTERRKDMREVLYRQGSQLYRCSEDNPEPQEVLRNCRFDAFTVSPDGILAYSSIYRGKPQIFQRSLLTKDSPPTLLFEFVHGASQPHFSPDGKSLAFVAEENAYHSIYTYSFAQKRFQKLSHQPAHYSSPSWFGDSQRLVCARDQSALLILSPRSEEVVLENFGSWLAEPCASASKELAFMSNHEGNPAIYRLTLGGQPQRLSKFSGYNTAPRFSADGRRLLFLSNQEGSNYRIYSMNLDGTEVSTITQEPCSAGQWAHY